MIAAGSERARRTPPAPPPPAPVRNRSPRSTPPPNVIPFVKRSSSVQSVPSIPDDFDPTNAFPTIVERSPLDRLPPVPASVRDFDATIVTRAPSIAANDDRTTSPAAIIPTPPVATPSSDRWAIFKQLGLVPKAKIQPQQAMAKAMVSAYRALGFIILSIIVVVLVGYLISSAFYFLSSSWVEPMVVSQTDEKVVDLQAQVTAAQNERDRIAADLDDADRNIAVEEQYQDEFAMAIKSDLDGRKAELGRVRALADGFAGTRAHIQAQNAAYAGASKKRMAQEYAAGLIDRQTMLSGKYELAQISSSSMGLKERQVEYQNRATELESQTQSLEALLDEKAGDSTTLSYDVLQIKKELEQSRLATQKAIEQRKTLQSALDRQDAIIAGLQSSPYLRALADGAQVAFVPYSNMSNVSKGTTLYACSIGMFWCHDVGKVVEVLPGEVTFKHPHKDTMLRGQMIELKLDSGAAQEDVLFAGGKPLGL